VATSSAKRQPNRWPALLDAASAQFAATASDFAYNVAAATFGLAMGWVVGIVISPGSKDEASEFSILTRQY